MIRAVHPRNKSFIQSIRIEEFAVRAELNTNFDEIQRNTHTEHLLWNRCMDV